jgi:single-stranded-DNA-specific exonuclease
MIHISYEHHEEDLITRLLKLRGLESEQSQEDFLNPGFKNARHNPWLLHDMDKAVERIIYAITNNQNIMVFGDYDADGVTSSYVMYDFFRTFLKYNKISVQLPHRVEDGYGVKSYHLDQMKEKWVELVITVDNGITAVAEAQHAKEIGLDIVITDHHQPLEVLPVVPALVNPQISPDYPFSDLCGVGVAYKVINAIAEKMWLSREYKIQMMNRYMPIVAIGTVSDCVSLLWENRLFVKKWLEIINAKHEHVPESLQAFLAHFNLYRKQIDSTDIGFMIGPRLNAAGRMLSAYEAFYALWYSGEKQKEYLERLGDLNDERRWIQEGMIKKWIEQLDLDQNILILTGEEYHEGIVWIVAWRLTEKYHKPSVVLKIDAEKWIGVASLRGPEYFSVIDMLYHAAPLLERFGGHKQAGGLTIAIDKIPELVQTLQEYCKNCITEEMMQKKKKVDTVIHHHELLHENFQLIDSLAPFWEGNREPVLLLQWAVVKHKQIMGKKSNHLKLYVQCSDKQVEIIQRKWAEDNDKYNLNESYDFVVTHRWDDSGRRYLVI